VPVQTTYPGVYIEEVPSAVRTIVGVSTSVTAFLGYTRRGATNEPTRVYSWGDFERAFGPLDVDSPVSYAVQQFFRNGGLEGWIVRVAAGAAPARIDIADAVTGGNPALRVLAKSEGVWGNNLKVEIDYDAANPFDQFNLTVVEYLEQGGVLLPGATETHRNLSMNKYAPNFAEATVNANSNLIELDRLSAELAVGRGTSESGPIDTNANNLPTLIGPGPAQVDRVLISVNGEPPVELTLASPGAADPAADIANDIFAQANAKGALLNARSTSGAATAKKIKVTAGGPQGENSSVRFLNAPTRNAAQLLKLGLANGGREEDASASLRPASIGTLGTDLSAVNLAALTADRALDVTANFASIANVTANVPLWKAADPPPSSLEDLRGRVEGGLRGAASANLGLADELATARVLLVDNTLLVIAGGNRDVVLTFANADAGNSATTLGLTTAARQNVAHYLPGVGSARKAQSGAVSGADGTPPDPTLLEGSELQKTGLYALADVDLFNILCVPPPGGPPPAGLNDLLSAAMTYCEQRRAFFIVDVPEPVDSLAEAQTWITAVSTPKSKNAAAYFPWVQLPDELQNYRLRGFPPSGMLAGLYARTDGSRGVWKAPAGTEATLNGPQGVAYKLSDPENGAINPLALNAIRAKPVYGTIAWGARTLVGSDQAASEWKYIPVRRLALYLEESLYRGTQWVVFEPNDAPLWAQIRLNVGAFMHNLFRQGAFQGASPRDAYLVKCDAETTTQNDINLGIVNIIVGFAPLKPAEFVILKITQLAGQIEA
jgi:Bacteriophage tail sheath protein